MILILTVCISYRLYVISYLPALSILCALQIYLDYTSYVVSKMVREKRDKKDRRINYEDIYHEKRLVLSGNVVLGLKKRLCLLEHHFRLEAISKGFVKNSWDSSRFFKTKICARFFFIFYKPILDHLKAEITYLRPCKFKIIGL